LVLRLGASTRRYPRVFLAVDFVGDGPRDTLDPREQM